MDAATVKAMLEQHFEYASSDPGRAHEMYAADVVLEFPQSGERFEGVDNVREWRSVYPTETAFELGEIRGRDDLWIAEVVVRYEGGPRNFGVSILEMDDGKIKRETIYVAEGFEAPEWRGRWRAP
jgi:hypothetical protein